MWTEVCLSQKPKSSPFIPLVLKGLVGGDKFADSPRLPFPNTHSIKNWVYLSSPHPTDPTAEASDIIYWECVTALRCFARSRLKTTDLEPVASGENKYPWLGQGSDPASTPPWQAASAPPNPSCQHSAMVTILSYKLWQKLLSWKILAKINRLWP